MALGDIHRHTHTTAWHLVTSTVISRGRRGTNSHPRSFCVAGVAQSDIHGRFCVAGMALMVLGGALGPDLSPVTPRHFAWQAWHKLTSTVVFAWQAWHSWYWVGALGPDLSACDAAALCVAVVALGDIHRHFSWQAWHKFTSTVVLRGRRGTIWHPRSHPRSFCVPGGAQSDIHGRFAWQAWHSWYWVARRLWRRGTLRGRRGTWWHPPSFDVAGVAQTHIHRRFAWQAWHSWYWVARLVRICRLWRRGTLRGRRGTWWHPPSFHVAGVARNSHPPSFCVAGVALMALGGALGPDLSPVTPRLFAWQALYLVTSTFISRGRRGTNSHPPSFLRGKRGTNSHPPSFCVAGVALMVLGGALGPDLSPVTPRHFAWQAWHLVTSTFVFTWQMWHKLTSTFVLRGRRGTYGTQWRAWTGLVARDARDAAALCVAGVAQSHIHLRFTWQARHNLTSTFVLRGRRGTHGTQWRAWTGLVARDASDAAALCVAGMAQSHIHLRFTWQAWHNLTSTVVLRGRRGTHGTGWRAWSGFVACDAAAVCVAGVAQSHIHLRFTWQAWHNLTSTFVFAWQAWHLATSTFVLSHTIFTIFHTPTLSHTIFHTHLCRTPSSTHHPSHTVSHTIFHHTILHTPLCHTPSFTTPSFTHIFVAHHLSPHHLSHTNFVTHHLSHTSLSHTIFRHTLFHTPLCHTPSFPHNFVTRSLSYTTFTHTIFHTQRCHTHHPHHLLHTTLSHTHNFVLLLDPPSPPLSFLPSPSPLQHLVHLVLIIGRSCLVGLSGPLILRHPHMYFHSNSAIKTNN